MKQKTVLSLSSDQEALASREVALRDSGIKVISVMSPIQARFEIEMGRCGILRICYRLSESAVNDLAKLFREYCPKGQIIFVTELPGDERVPAEVDITLPECGGPERIVQELKQQWDSGAAA